MPPKLKILSAILLISGFLHSSYAFAGTSCSVANYTEYANALKNADCSDIVLTGNINLSGQAQFDFGSRNTINIEGNNQYSITNPGSMKAIGGNSTKQVNLNFKNLTLATKTASNAANNVLLYVPNMGSNINTTFDQISTIPNMTLTVMSNGTDAGSGVLLPNNVPTNNAYYLNQYDSNYKLNFTYNQNIYSKVTIGTFLSSNKDNPFYSTTNKQWVNGSKIDFTGTLDFYGTGIDNQFAYIFWNNTNDLLQNQLTFKNGADVSFNLDTRTKLTTGI